MVMVLRMGFLVLSAVLPLALSLQAEADEEARAGCSSSRDLVYQAILNLPLDWMQCGSEKLAPGAQ